MNLTKEQLNKFAEKAGFGGNQRNTYRVKLELFAKQVWEAAQKDRDVATNTDSVQYHTNSSNGG
jgi:AMMECR1 domain-containing protein